ncbi:Crp/Fnr family transcriptional regulator [Aquibium oceanicum]|uniref:Crp/Fnr family transcriptional regulator n=1 Tax=Aquibium oceanicum TaxID=1670800 RepID=A0A1L3SXF0_9HYPH|nr:Crp/Fnr family transcriptional regulator [Aquibium oceanicum]APH74041.1 Crp/Fnr family transcriptional regulator [Aquibium oceanicum]
MNEQRQQATRQHTCERCPLRPLPIFREFAESELDFVASFKKGELTAERGASVLIEGSHNAHLYTVLSGWGFRYKMLRDGRRQVLNYVMPGDLIGLQGTLMGEMQHSVEALSPLLLCVFERSKLDQLYKCHPGLAFDITWLAAREEQMLDENLLSVGRRTALERAAFLIASLTMRAKAVGLNGNAAVGLPITQQLVADTLGLSLVHTNKTMRKLADRGLIRWRDRGCEVLDLDRLRDIAHSEFPAETKRPLV